MQNQELNLTFSLRHPDCNWPLISTKMETALGKLPSQRIVSPPCPYPSFPHLFSQCGAFPFLSPLTLISSMLISFSYGRKISSSHSAILPVGLDSSASWRWGCPSTWSCPSSQLLSCCIWASILAIPRNFIDFFFPIINIFTVVIKAFSNAAAETNGEISSDQAEGLVLQLLQHPLSEEILDTIISITEGINYKSVGCTKHWYILFAMEGIGTGRCEL